MMQLIKQHLFAALLDTVFLVMVTGSVVFLVLALGI